LVEFQSRLKLEEVNANIYLEYIKEKDLLKEENKNLKNENDRLKIVKEENENLRKRNEEIQREFEITNAIIFEEKKELKNENSILKKELENIKSNYWDLKIKYQSISKQHIEDPPIYINKTNEENNKNSFDKKRESFDKWISNSDEK